MDVCEPAFYDFWQQVFAAETWDVGDLAQARRCSRAFRAVADAHGRSRVDLNIYGHLLHHAAVRASSTRFANVVDYRLRDSYDGFFATRCLPPRLISLHFGLQFDTLVDFAGLPCTLQVLCFGGDFNKKLDLAALPSGLTELRFGREYNHRIDAASLPRALEVLVLGDRYNHWLDLAALPSGLTELRFGNDYAQVIVAAALPRSLRTLHVCERYFQRHFAPIVLSHLPRLHSMSLAVTGWNVLDAQDIPSSVRVLRVIGTCDITSESIPPTVRELVFDGCGSRLIHMAYLPRNLTSLSLSDKYHYRVDTKALPRTLLVLRVPGCCRSVSARHMPRGLRVLEFGRLFRAPLDVRRLPRTLTDLTLGENYDHDVEPKHLPPALTRLAVTRRLRERLGASALPASLTRLCEA